MAFYGYLLPLLAILAASGPEAKECHCAFNPNSLTLGEVTTLVCIDVSSNNLLELKELPHIDGLSWLNSEGAKSFKYPAIALRSGEIAIPELKAPNCRKIALPNALIVRAPFDLDNPPPPAPNSGPAPIYIFKKRLLAAATLLFLLACVGLFLKRRKKAPQRPADLRSLWANLMDFTISEAATAEELKAAFIEYFAIFRALLAELSGRRGSQPTVYELKQICAGDQDMESFLERGNYLAYSSYLATFAEYSEYVTKSRRLAAALRDMAQDEAGGSHDSPSSTFLNN